MRTLNLPVLMLITLSLQTLSYKILHKGSDTSEDSTGSLPEDQQQYIDEQYKLFMENRKKEREEKEKANKPPPPPEGITPSKLGMKRNLLNTSQLKQVVEITPQASIPGGVFWFGSQMNIDNKIAPSRSTDGSKPRKKATVKDFSIDIDCVTNEQFLDFVKMTNYVTEGELYGWSFVLETEASSKVIEQVDSDTGYGRVKTAKHWMAVPGADWKHPHGPDSTFIIHNIAKDTKNNKNNYDAISYPQYPAVHISYKDAYEYCLWVGRRLPTEKEWEYASRGGLINKTYSWGDIYQPGKNIQTTRGTRDTSSSSSSTTRKDNKSKQKHPYLMNIWDGKKFPLENPKSDGYIGIAPVITSYPPNAYGVHNTLGNVWEWVSGGTADKRILRGGSYIDSLDGSFNHAVMVSTRQENSGDSAASNVGFRCASSNNNSINDKADDNSRKKTATKRKKGISRDNNEQSKKDSSSSSSGSSSSSNINNKQNEYEDVIEL